MKHVINPVVMGKGILEQIKNIRNYAEDNNQLDEQWFLDFMDELNQLSIDPDREDTHSIYLGDGKVQFKDGTIYDIQ